MLQKLTGKGALWIMEAVGVHDAVLQRIATPTTTMPDGTVRDAHAQAIIDAARIQAAATIAAAIFERAGSTGPYDLLEDDPEGQQLLDAERQRRDRDEVQTMRERPETT